MMHEALAELVSRLRKCRCEDPLCPMCPNAIEAVAANEIERLQTENESLQAGRVRYYLDRDGFIWKGPICSDGTMHYAKESGKDEAGRMIWVCYRSSPDPTWVDFE